MTVKTYPELSTKYGETVCTAGLREDGSSWVRLYPVPYRQLDREQQYRLYDWVECNLIRHSGRDYRPESFRPVGQIKTVGSVDTSDNWRARREIVLRTATVYRSMTALIGKAKANKASLAVYRPVRIVDFTWEETHRTWGEAKRRAAEALVDQPDLFEDNLWRETFQVVDKIPYRFYYHFEDEDGKSSKMQVLEWQLGALYRNCLKSCRHDEAAALSKVRQKYGDEFLTKDLHFFLGTTLRWHKSGPNPWTIVGVFPIPHEQQLDVFSDNSDQ